MSLLNWNFLSTAHPATEALLPGNHHLWRLFLAHPVGWNDLLVAIDLSAWCEVNLLQKYTGARREDYKHKPARRPSV